MIRRFLSVLFLFAVVSFFAASGCSKSDKEIKFNPIPEGTPTVTTGGGPRKGGDEQPVPPKVIRKVQD